MVGFYFSYVKLRYLMHNSIKIHSETFHFKTTLRGVFSVVSQMKPELG